MDFERPRRLEDLPFFLKTEEVAAVLGVSVAVVRKWLARGLIPSVKKGRRRWVRREDLFAEFDPKKKRRRRGR